MNQKTLKRLLTVFSVILILVLILFRAGNREDEPGRLLEETLVHKLYADGELYTLRIYNLEGERLREDGPSSKPFTVTEEEPGIWSVSLNAGAELSTRWTYFFTPSDGRISQTFYGVFDEEGGLLIRAEQNALVVQSIFEDEPYWELDEFSQPLAETAEPPFVNAAFVEEGKAVKVTYRSGEDFHEVTEILPLA